MGNNIRTEGGGFLWARVALVALALAYVFAETRYPALNYDDTYWMGKHYPAIAKGRFWDGGLYFMMFQHNMATNEFRTFGLSKVIHFGLYKIFGAALSPYYLIMAAMSVASAMFAATAARTLTGSHAVATGLAGCCLLGPFMLFQTFHHAAYLLLPLLLTTAYLALDVRGARHGAKKVIAPVLCVLIVMTGEIAAFVLLAALALLLARAWQVEDRSRARALAVDLLVTASVLAALYVYYRLAIFDPSLPTRFASEKPLAPRSVWVAFIGFNRAIAELIASGRAREVLAAAVTLDLQVIVAIVASAILAVVAIVRAPIEPARISARPAMFLLMLYGVSFAAYVIVAAKAGVANFPTRYLHVSGLLMIGAMCMLAGCTAPITRKALLSSLVLVSAGAGVLTYGVKVPTLEAVHAKLKADVLAEKSRGGERVVFLAGRGSGGLMDPYKFEPAQTPLREWWIMGNYCLLEWGLSCAPGTSEKAGDIVVGSEGTRNGLPTRISVRAGRST
jgi:hypothetical protein